MRIGSAYYPEHWPSDRVQTDINMMVEAGLSVVRLGEFAWTLMEPRSGQFDFGWLDDAVAALGSAGIAVIMGTPTAAPPKWLMDRHPEVYPVDRYGHRKGFGHRDYYSVNAPALWRYIDRLVGEMADRYANNPAVIGWQIDNEIGGADSTLSYGECDRRAFIEWLQNRYTTIDELNEAWGTRFSNQVYTSFEEIIVPSYGAIDLHNPGLELDFRRFSSDAAIEFIFRQARVIRAVAPQAVVTTNFMANFMEIDYFKLASELDVVAMGAYPNCNPREADRPGDTAYYHDAAYGCMRKDYWMLEHQSGTPGSTTLKPSPRPGDIGRWSAQSLARGSDIVLYFRWRTCTVGVEQYWHGILPHGGYANRRLEEVARFAGFAGSVQSVGASRPPAEVALLLSHDNAWVFDVQPHAPGHSYQAHLRCWYRALFARNVPVDVVGRDDDLSGYRIVIAPHLAIVDLPDDETPLSQRLATFVAAGGTLVCDWRSGTRSAENRMLESPAPGPLAEVLGVRIDDYGIIEKDEKQTIVAAGGSSPSLDAYDWFEELALEGAEVKYTYEHEYLAGAPAITANRHGKGTAWYFSTVPRGEALERLVAEVCKEAGVRPRLETPRGVEAVSRYDGDRELLFLINHGSGPAAVEIPDGYDLIHVDGTRPGTPPPSRGSALSLDPRAFAVLARTEGGAS